MNILKLPGRKWYQIKAGHNSSRKTKKGKDVNKQWRLGDCGSPPPSPLLTKTTTSTNVYLKDTCMSSTTPNPKILIIKSTARNSPHLQERLQIYHYKNQRSRFDLSKGGQPCASLPETSACDRPKWGFVTTSSPAMSEIVTTCGPHVPRIDAIGWFAATNVDAATGFLRVPAHRPRKVEANVGCSDPRFWCMCWIVIGWCFWLFERTKHWGCGKGGNLVCGDGKMSERARQRRFWTVRWKSDGSIVDNGGQKV